MSREWPLVAEAVWKPKSENSKWEIKSDSRIIV